MIIGFIFIILSVLLIKYFYSFSNSSNRIDIEQRTRDNIIRNLVTQSARWCTASKHDNSPLIKNLHGNYCAGYLWALKDFATGEEIAKAANLDFHRFQKEVVNTQREATQFALKHCPSFGPSGYLAEIASGKI